MDDVTCENVTVSLVKRYPLGHQTLHLVTVIQPTKYKECLLRKMLKYINIILYKLPTLQDT